MKLSTQSITSFSAKHPWWILGGWLLILACAFVSVSNLLPSALEGEGGPTKTLEYKIAENLINEKFDTSGESQSSESDTSSAENLANEFVIINSETVISADPVFEETISELADAIDRQAGSIINGNFSDYSPVPSQDGSTVMYQIQVFQDKKDEIHILTDTAANFDRDGFKVVIFGDISINEAFSTRAEHDLLVGESIGIGVALIILILVYGAVVAGLIPIILAIVAVFTTIGITGVVGQMMELNEFVPNIITMMGLAVGIDYSLFILSRYREERQKGFDQQESISIAGATASRAVLFSGVTVVFALTGMLLLPEKFFQAFGTGSIMVVFVAVITCLTLLPALIGILGDRINSVRVPPIPTAIMFLAGVAIIPGRTEPGRIMAVAGVVMSILILVALLRRLTGFKIPFLSVYDRNITKQRRGFWDTITLTVMRAPVVSMIVSVTILGALIIPFFELSKGTSGISMLPDDEPVKQAFELLNTKYGFGSNSPALVVIDGDVMSGDIKDAISRLEANMDADDKIIKPEIRISPDGTLAVLQAPLPGDPFGEEALSTVRRIRSELIPEAFAGVSADNYKALVGGASAEIVDSVELTNEYTPRVFAAVLGLSFILLMIAFRSIVIPIASIFMNLLSVGAAYGIVVLVFQKGFMLDLLGFQKVEHIEYWLPLMMFSILFGLSMDYHVFMLSRIKEHYDETGEHSTSVAFGLRTTAQIITGAALIMVAVFGGFALGDIAFFQSMGFGLGAAILLDATIVRSMLVPSVLRLLGTTTWYFPKALEFIPNVSIEGKYKDKRR
jgi:RND superfamily putative drug exporter